MANIASRLTPFAPLAGGIVVAAGTIALLENFPMRWVFALLGGLLLLFPPLIIKNPRAYGIGLFLILLMIQGGKGVNLTKNIIDDVEIVETLGIPPLRTLGLMIRPSDVVLLCLVGNWLLSVLKGKEKIRVSWPGYLALAYLAWAALSSILNASYFNLSILEFIQQARAILVFFYVSNAVNSTELVRKLRTVLIVCLLLEGSLALIGWKVPAASDLLSLLGDSSREGTTELAVAFEDGTGRRALGTFKDYAVTALYLHFLLPLALCRFVLSPEARIKRSYLLLYLLGFAALLATFSRAGLIAELSGLACWLLLAYRNRMVSGRALVLIACSVLLLVVSLSPLIEDYIMSRPTMALARLPIMEKGLQMIAQRPVLGVGLNNSTAIKKETFIVAQGMEDTSQFVHNHYMIIAMESGLVGLALFLGFFVAVSREALHQTRSPNPEISAFAISILCAFVACGVQVLFDTLGSYVIFTMLFFYAGLVVAFQRMNLDAVPRNVGLS